MLELFCSMISFQCLKDTVPYLREAFECGLPHLKPHFDYWWCFDNNIQQLKDGIRDLDRETLHMSQKIEEARFSTEKLRPEVVEWSNAGATKLAEAKKFIQDLKSPTAWKLISRYSIGKSAKKTAEEIATLLNEENFNRISDPSPPPSMGSTTHGRIMEFGSRKRIEEEIIESLRDSSVGMIGICGMGGVGKTTMMQKIKKRVKDEKLFDEIVMIVVSQQKDMFKIQEELAELFGLDFDRRITMSARAHQLQTRLVDPMRKIIIFDDVWEKLKLEDLGVPDIERCKILMSTRSRDVCERMEAQKIISMEILTKDEAWILFQEKAGNCVEDSALIHVAKDVVAECNDLPIALVTVGKALQNKKKSIWMDSLSQLRKSNPVDFPEVLADVYKPLKLSYNYLENEHERMLFLLCCLFPEDHDIFVEQLAWYSMGLGIFDDITGTEEARNRMHRLVEKLKSRFLLIDAKNELHVKMHDVVRDVAIYIGFKEEDGFLRSLAKTSIKNSSDGKCNWMSVDISKERMEDPVGLCFPKLHLLMLLKLSSNEFSDISLKGFEDLNVLSFSYMSMGSLPPMLGLLQNLRTLYLYFCVLENISIIGEVAGLEILCCYGCDIEELPAEIGSLDRLRFLELNECRKLQRIPFGVVSSLVRLEELKIRGSFSAWETGGERGNAALTELGSLPNLTCLEIEISDFTLSAQEICLSPYLVKYFIQLASLDYSIEERDYKKSMNLTFPGDIAVGKWIKMLVRNTEYLYLEGEGSSNFNIAECENLRELLLWDCSRVNKLVKTEDFKLGTVFPLLETLNLYELENLEEICDGTILNQSVSLRNLKSVDIRSCSNLRYIFSGSMARCILQLEVLEIVDCRKLERVFSNEITDYVDACIEFPKLKTLRLDNLPSLTAFCQGLEIKFHKLTEMWIGGLPKFNSESTHDHTTSHFLCNQKVEMGGIMSLTLFNWGG